MANDGGQTLPRIARAEHIGPNDTGDNIEAKRVAVYNWNGSTWERGLTPAATTYKTLLDDYTTTNVTYVGKAAIGSATSSAVWQIQKIDETSGMVITWGGTGAFDQVWNNRATTVSYS